MPGGVGGVLLWQPPIPIVVSARHRARRECRVAVPALLFVMDEELSPPFVNHEKEVAQ